jgi:hypothetical protein
MTHKDQVTGMTRAFLDYMKSLRLRAPEAVNPPPGPRFGSDVDIGPEPDSAPEPETDETSLDLGFTDQGYPILRIIMIKKQLTKTQSEGLFRAFLSHHYCKILLIFVRW